MTYLTLEAVAMEARAYPARHLEGLDTGLVLFAAAWQGHNDAIHFAEAGIRTTCVDTDAHRLEEMERIYPEDWTFVPGDAFAYADTARVRGHSWDVVSLDPFTGETMERVHEELELWAAIASRVLIVGALLEAQPLELERWRESERMERSAIAQWIVLERIP